MQLTNGSRVGILGGGPSGSLTGYFLLEIAERAGLELSVDIYEPKDFSQPGPAGCNMCGGVVSESLVQLLATEGINLPREVVARAIDSYVLHSDAGSVRIETPLHEKRIAAVYRGSGPWRSDGTNWRSFDGFLLDRAVARGARRIADRVTHVERHGDQLRVETRHDCQQSYDLLVAATGLNAGSAAIYDGLGLKYRAPHTMKTHIRELYFDPADVEARLGSSMHVFLLNIPGLEFAALVPKGGYVTLCLLGPRIDDSVVRAFLHAPEVTPCLPPGGDAPQDLCHCSPKMNVGSAVQPFADRIVFVGDCGTSRLYKDGIGSAYRTAKAAATTAVLEGVSGRDFRRHFWPACRALSADNRVGRFIFGVNRRLMGSRRGRRGLLSMVAREQEGDRRRRLMSAVLWDLFTGSASYRAVLLHSLHPMLIIRLLWHLTMSSLPLPKKLMPGTGWSHPRTLGQSFDVGDVIVRQGAAGDCMYVIQYGEVEVVRESDGQELRLAVLKERDFFGEVPLFEREKRSATVRALGNVRVLTVDRKTLLQRINEDPSLAYRILQTLSHRVRDLDATLARAMSDAPTRPSGDGEA